MSTGTIVAVCASGDHEFSKQPGSEIRLVAGLGVEGDAHSGKTVKHRSRVAVDPSQPNLRQVHLIHAELFDELQGIGFQVGPGNLGENIVTRGLDLLALPKGSELQLGKDARIELTGLRNPCAQIERFQPGLLAAVLDKAPDGAIIRKAGVMAIVRTGGTVRPGDPVTVRLPEGTAIPLEPV